METVNICSSNLVASTGGLSSHTQCNLLPRDVSSLVCTARRNSCHGTEALINIVPVGHVCWACSVYVGHLGVDIIVRVLQRLAVLRFSCRNIRLGTASSSYKGLPAPTRKAGKPALISRISRLEVHYTVQWPLNVIVSDEQISTYQQLFPVLLQVLVSSPCAMCCVYHLGWVALGGCASVPALWSAEAHSLSGMT